METVPGTDAYVMAGTYEVSSSFSGIHFIYYDQAAGGIVTSKVFNISHRDLRSVDIAVVDATHFFITALLRDNLTTNGKDRIKILEVDDQGTILLDEILESAVTTSTGYRNMYPLHSIWFNEQLYICGYIGQYYYAYPNVPFYGQQDSKLAFVLSFDPNTLGVLCNTWDYVITPTQPVRTDYDIAMRMVPIDADAIYVTGSCNTAIPGFSGDEYPSATLSLFINPTTLQTTTGYSPLFTGAPFVDQNAIGATNGRGEYGVGIIPDPGGSGGFFVIGNDFTSDSHGTPSNGFAPFPEFYWLTYLDPGSNYFPPTGALTNRIRSDWDYAWLLQSLPGQYNDRFVLAGMTAHMWYPCYQNYPSTFDNYNPFLTEITPGWTGTSISLATHWWEFYESRLGTGVIGVNANNYRDLGGGISNIAWNPTFATRQTDFNITTDIMMNAPVFNPNNNKLNFKLIRTDKDGIVTQCDFNSTDCQPVYGDFYAISALLPAATHYTIEIPTYFNINVHDDGTSEFKYDPDADYECDNSFYKQAAPYHVGKSIGQTTISPNPASDFIQVFLNVTDIAEIKIELFNTVGQRVAELYQGAVKRINSSKFPLPSVTKGLYFLTVTGIDGKPISKHKLLIQ